MNLSLWLVVVSLTPACLKARTAQYEACQKAKVVDAVCVPPQEILSQSLTVGRPALDLKPGLDDSCLQVAASEFKATASKPVSVKDWNAKADKDARPVR